MLTFFLTTMLTTVLALAVAVGAALIAGQAGCLGGTRPSDLGIRDGRLKPVAETSRNSVASQASQASVHVAPLRYHGNGRDAFGVLQSVVASMSGARVIHSEADYLYAEFQSKWLKFIDDVEFQLDESRGLIDVRSASRVGSGDLGVNRARIETIRRAFSAALPAPSPS